MYHKALLMMSKKDYLQDISEIKNIMNKSSRFLSLSGLSGVLAGIYALVGAYFAKYLVANYNYFLHYQNTINPKNIELKLIAIALVVALLSILSGYILTRSKARKQGVKIAYDSNYRARLYKNSKKANSLYEEALKHCDIFLPSIDDEKELLGDIKAKHIIKKAKKAKVQEIIIKAGKKSVIYHNNNQTKKIKIKALDKIVDSTSAGDSFNGGYLASRLNNKSIKESILFASNLASKVIMHKGAIIPKDKHE